MTEYWKSLPRYHCIYCDVWLVNNKANVTHHESGDRHKARVNQYMNKKRKEKELKEHGDKNVLAEIRNIEMKAMNRMKADGYNVSPAFQSSEDQSEVKRDIEFKIAAALADKSKQEAQENPWQQYYTEEGYPYWCNIKTGESTWYDPNQVQEEQQQPEQKQEVQEEQEHKVVHVQLNGQRIVNRKIEVVKNDEAAVEVKAEVKEEEEEEQQQQPYSGPYAPWVEVDPSEKSEYIWEDDEENQEAKEEEEQGSDSDSEPETVNVQKRPLQQVASDSEEEKETVSFAKRKKIQGKRQFRKKQSSP